jgi:nanoRNase/pAp phosphatase (c-di-AMP/oligoRNAs hydrolase)
MKLASLNTFDENHAGATFNVVDFHKVSFSLRSLENGIDVSEIAKHTPLDFGLTSGGGHKHAAGMRLDLESLSKVITKFDLA